MFFTNIATNLKTKFIPLKNFVWHYHTQPKQSEHLFKFRPVTTKEVWREIKNLKTKKATGVDDIPARLIEDCANVICSPLTHIFNLSLTNAFVPDEWKIAKVTPIFKSGDQNDFNNYRPISVLPVVSKIMEKLVHKQYTRSQSQQKVRPKLF